MPSPSRSRSQAAAPRLTARVAPAPDARFVTRAAMFILAATMMRLLWLAHDSYPLYGDEAQYWVWAQSPDWGYVSKPPLIAWLIATTTALLGDTEFGVRAAAPICHAVIALLVTELGRRLFDTRTGAWSGALYVSLPAVSLSSILMSTDAPLLLFWAIGLLAFVRALEPGHPRRWIAVGLALGLGLLSKYAMATFVPSAALYLALSSKHRGVLRTRWPYMALALGLALFLPNLVWNLDHDWLSFRHTGANANLAGPLFHPLKLAEFVGSQVGVLGPLLFGVFLAVLVARFTTLRRDERYWLLTAFALPQLAIIAVEALLSRAHANWAATSYVSALVLVVAWCRSVPTLRLLLPVSLGLNVAVAGAMVGYHDLARLAGIELTRKTDPFNRLRGWNYLGNAVAALLAERPGFVLMTDDRMLFAELAFYVRPRPPQVEWNQKDHPTDEFELTTNILPYGNRPILYVTENPDPRDVLARFQQVDKTVEHISIPLYRGDLRRYSVFGLQGFKG